MSAARRELRVDARAEAEARAAFLWYVARNPRAADEFAAALERCMASILEGPERFPEIEAGVRRAMVLDRFPYAVLFRASADAVLVLAVMHLRRRPGYRRF